MEDEIAIQLRPRSPAPSRPLARLDPTRLKQMPRLENLKIADYQGPDNDEAEMCL